MPLFAVVGATLRVGAGVVPFAVGLVGATL